MSMDRSFDRYRSVGFSVTFLEQVNNELLEGISYASHGPQSQNVSADDDDAVRLGHANLGLGRTTGYDRRTCARSIRRWFRVEQGGSAAASQRFEGGFGAKPIDLSGRGRRGDPTGYCPADRQGCLGRAFMGRHGNH